jgi:hypothetical protein
MRGRGDGPSIAGEGAGGRNSAVAERCQTENPPRRLRRLIRVIERTEIPWRNCGCLLSSLKLRRSLLSAALHAQRRHDVSFVGGKRIACVYDITALTEHQAQVAEQERQLREILDFCPAGLKYRRRRGPAFERIRFLADCTIGTLERRVPSLPDRSALRLPSRAQRPGWLAALR